MLFKLMKLFCFTEFADLTWQEFQRYKLGAAQNCSATLKGSHKITEAAVPDTVTIPFLFFYILGLLRIEVFDVWSESLDCVITERLERRWYC